MGEGEPKEEDAGDHKGPPIHPSSTLAPTDVDELCLRLMPIETQFIAPTGRGEHQASLPTETRDATTKRQLHPANEHGNQAETLHSLSVVLPAYNEEHVIDATLEQVLDVMAACVRDFEVIVVNDGSTDRTGEILAAITEAEPRVRLPRAAAAIP